LKIHPLKSIKYAAKFAKKVRLVAIVVLVESIHAESLLGVHAMDNNTKV